MQVPDEFENEKDEDFKGNSIKIHPLLRGPRRKFSAERRRELLAGGGSAQERQALADAMAGADPSQYNQVTTEDDSISFTSSDEEEDQGRARHAGGKGRAAGGDKRQASQPDQAPASAAGDQAMAERGDRVMSQRGDRAQPSAAQDQAQPSAAQDQAQPSSAQDQAPQVGGLSIYVAPIPRAPGARVIVEDDRPYYPKAYPGLSEFREPVVSLLVGMDHVGLAPIYPYQRLSLNRIVQKVGGVGQYSTDLGAAHAHKDADALGRQLENRQKFVQSVDFHLAHRCNAPQEAILKVYVKKAKVAYAEGLKRLTHFRSVADTVDSDLERKGSMLKDARKKASKVELAHYEVVKAIQAMLSYSMILKQSDVPDFEASLALSTYLDVEGWSDYNENIGSDLARRADGSLVPRDEMVTEAARKLDMEAAFNMIFALHPPSDPPTMPTSEFMRDVVQNYHMPDYSKEGYPFRESRQTMFSFSREFERQVLRTNISVNRLEAIISDLEAAWGKHTSRVAKIAMRAAQVVRGMVNRYDFLIEEILDAFEDPVAKVPFHVKYEDFVDDRVRMANHWLYRAFSCARSLRLQSKSIILYLETHGHSDVENSKEFLRRLFTTTFGYSILPHKVGVKPELLPVFKRPVAPSSGYLSAWVSADYASMIVRWHARRKAAAQSGAAGGAAAGPAPAQKRKAGNAAFLPTKKRCVDVPVSQLYSCPPDASPQSAPVLPSPPQSALVLLSPPQSALVLLSPPQSAPAPAADPPQSASVLPSLPQSASVLPSPAADPPQSAPVLLSLPQSAPAPAADPPQSASVLPSLPQSAPVLPSPPQPAPDFAVVAGGRFAATVSAFCTLVGEVERLDYPSEEAKNETVGKVRAALNSVLVNAMK